MSKRHSIESFPADIDRDAFGHWLSGFTDGEGCFALGWAVGNRLSRPVPMAYFSLALRMDDWAILALIQRFWGCGGLIRSMRTRDEKQHPAGILRVQRVEDVAGILVPHFDRYPLRAKKARDFVTWREGVALCLQVHRRKRTFRPGRRGNGYRWTLAEWKHFEELIAIHRGQRVYLAPAAVVSSPVAEDRTLFD